MVYGAIDLHLRKSHIRVLDEDGRVLRERVVVTSRETLVSAFAGVGAVRILVESATESEWVAQALEAAGYEVVVADPNFAPMYGDRQRKVKTDGRDVAALAEANRRGWYRPAHRTSAAQRSRRQLLRARRQLVQMRSGTISVIRALLRQTGVRVGAGSAERFVTRLATVTVPPTVAPAIAPLTRTLETLTRELVAMEKELVTIAQAIRLCGDCRRSRAWVPSAR